MRSRLTYILAALAVVFFAGVGGYTAIGGFDDYSIRKAFFPAKMLSDIKDAIGPFGAFAVCLGIGISIAIWTIFGKDDD